MVAAAIASHDVNDDTSSVVMKLKGSSTSGMISWLHGSTNGTSPSPRDGHIAWSDSSRIYVWGGIEMPLNDDDDDDDGHGHGDDDNDDTLYSLDIDVDSSTWRTVTLASSTERPLSRASSAVAVVGRHVFIYGGMNSTYGWLNELLLYDLDTHAWHVVKNATGDSPPRCDKLQCVVNGPHVLFYGGFGPSESEEGEFHWLDTVYVLDTEAMHWLKIPCSGVKPTPRAAHGMALLGGDLYVFGGRDCTARQNDLHRLDTTTWEWHVVNAEGTVPAPRSFCSMTAISSTRLAIVGGRGRDNEHFGDLHIYDSEINRWSQPTFSKDIPPRGWHASCIVNTIDHDECLAIHGGSSDFDDIKGQCSSYFADLWILPLVRLGTLKNHL